MSFSHCQPLDEVLVVDILTPLMEYAATLEETGERGPQGRLLWTLINDVKRRMEETFNVVNTQSPGIHVEIGHIQ